MDQTSTKISGSTTGVSVSFTTTTTGKGEKKKEAQEEAETQPKQRMEDLQPVDRQSEVEAAIRWWKHDHTTSDKPTLLYLPQLYGSGKTFFGRNMIQLLRNSLQMPDPENSPGIVGALMHPNRMAQDSRNDLQNLRFKRDFSFEEIQSYAKAVTVIADLCEMPLPHISENKIFKYGFFPWLLKLGVEACGIKPETLSLDRFIVSDVTSLIESLKKITGHQGKWFFFIDEMGLFDDGKNSFWECFTDLAKVTSEELRHRNIMGDILMPFLKYKDTFLMCAGRSVSLASRALTSETTSRIQLQYFAIGTLSVEDVVAVMKETKVGDFFPNDSDAGQSFSEFLTLHGSVDENAIAQIIHYWTGGVGRLVKSVVVQLFTSRGNCQSPEKNWTIDFIEKLVCPSGGIGSKAASLNTVALLPNFSALSQAYYDIYNTFFLMCLLFIFIFSFFFFFFSFPLTFRLIYEQNRYSERTCDWT